MTEKMRHCLIFKLTKETKMYESRIRYIEETHRILNEKIDLMERTGNFDDIELTKLKKQRLQYRDELAKLRRLQWEHDHETVDWDDER